MTVATTQPQAPTFYTVREAAKVLRCDPSTLYRAIREDTFPAIRIRTRYIVPAEVVNQMIRDAAETGACIDVAKIASQRRIERELRRITGH
jgi:excisionase family DNA binding protein